MNWLILAAVVAYLLVLGLTLLFFAGAKIARGDHD